MRRGVEPLWALHLNLRFASLLQKPFSFLLALEKVRLIRKYRSQVKEKVLYLWILNTDRRNQIDKMISAKKVLSNTSADNPWPGLSRAEIDNCTFGIFWGSGRQGGLVIITEQKGVPFLLIKVIEYWGQIENYTEPRLDCWLVMLRRPRPGLNLPSEQQVDLTWHPHTQPHTPASLANSQQQTRIFSKHHLEYFPSIQRKGKSSPLKVVNNSNKTWKLLIKSSSRCLEITRKTSQLVQQYSHCRCISVYHSPTQFRPTEQNIKDNKEFQFTKQSTNNIS